MYNGFKSFVDNVHQVEDDSLRDSEPVCLFGMGPVEHDFLDSVTMKAALFLSR